MIKRNKKRNYKKNNNKNIIIIFIIIVITFLLIFVINKNYSNRALKDIGYKIYKPFELISNNLKDIQNYQKYKEENTKLKNLQIKEAALINRNKELEEENKNFKRLNNIDKLYKDYKIEYAKVIIRNKLYWLDELTINKGKKDGIKENNAVITENGLIGKIESVNNNTSVVRLIISNSKSKTSVSVKTTKGEKVGLIMGYQDDYLEIEGITNYDNVMINDKVYTTGLGNLPKGIYIGSVSSIKEDKYKTSKLLYVKLEQDINSLYLVGVLVEK